MYTNIVRRHFNFTFRNINYQQIFKQMDDEQMENMDNINRGASKLLKTELEYTFAL